MREGAEHFDDFSGPLAAGDDDDDIDGGIFGKVVLHHRLARAKRARRAEGSPFQDGKLGIEDSAARCPSSGSAAIFSLRSEAFFTGHF